jgi:hypothetical protein
MRAAVVVATRELRDRSRFLIIAAGMAFVPFIAGWTLRDHRQIGMAAVAGFLALAYSGVVALMLGISTIGGELTEKRLSFLFARPLSPAAMWGGKAAAALVISLGAFAIIVLPTWLFAHGGWSDMWSERGGAPTTPLYPIVLCTVLFFGGHAVSTMVRSRSARLALDFAFCGLTLFAVVALVRPILGGGAGHTAIQFLIAIGLALLALLAVAPVWQLARGRIDPRRNHAALSTVLWSGVAVILAVAAAYVLWVTSPPLSALTEIYALNQSPTGAWVFVAGQATERGRYPVSYLIQSATGERERLEMPVLGPYAFSPDGRMLVWLENTSVLGELDSKNGDMRERLESAERRKATGAYRLYMRRLEPGAKQVATPLIVPMPGIVQLSDDGSRIAMSVGQRLEVYDVANGRLLAAAQRSGDGYAVTIVFAGPDVVRIVEYRVAPPKIVRISSLDVVRRNLTTVERPAPEKYAAVGFSGDGSRMYLGDESTVLDPGSGAVLARLPIQPETRDAGAMLRDGSLIVTRDSKLFHITADGQIAAEIPIPMPAGHVAGQVGASKILLEGRRGVVIVDLAAKKVSVSPGDVYGPILSLSRSVVPQFTDNATFVGIGRGRKFLLWDARTGAKRPFPG